jgi:hypothetical protein
MVRKWLKLVQSAAIVIGLHCCDVETVRNVRKRSPHKREIVITKRFCRRILPKSKHAIDLARVAEDSIHTEVQLQRSKELVIPHRSVEIRGQQLARNKQVCFESRQGLKRNLKSGSIRIAVEDKLLKPRSPRDGVEISEHPFASPRIAGEESLGCISEVDRLPQQIIHRRGKRCEREVSTSKLSHSRQRNPSAFLSGNPSPSERGLLVDDDVRNRFANAVCSGYRAGLRWAKFMQESAAVANRKRCLIFLCQMPAQSWCAPGLLLVSELTRFSLEVAFMLYQYRCAQPRHALTTCFWKFPPDDLS